MTKQDLGNKLFLHPFGLTENLSYWHGKFVSLDGTEAGPIIESDVEEVLHYADTGRDWDGDVAAVIKLKDGRLVAWEAAWGPTGDGFSEDAYGGYSDVYFASDLDLLIRMALSDSSRRLLGLSQPE